MKKIRPSDAKRVGIWIRVSTEDQAQGESPEHHETRARDATPRRRAGTSSRSTTSKPSPGSPSWSTRRRSGCWKTSRRGRITGLIFSKLARLARNTQELLEFADIFREHGADLVSLQESIDTSTPPAASSTP